MGARRLTFDDVLEELDAVCATCQEIADARARAEAPETGIWQTVTDIAGGFADLARAFADLPLELEELRPTDTDAELAMTVAHVGSLANALCARMKGGPSVEADAGVESLPFAVLLDGLEPNAN